MHRRAPASGDLVWSDDVKGRVLDVSDTGLSISTSRSFKPGEYVSFRVIGEHWSLVSGEVRWVEKDSVKIAPSGETITVNHVGLALLHDPRRLRRTDTG